MGLMTDVPFGTTHIFKNLTVGPNKYSHWTAGDKNGKGKPEYRATWSNGGINAYKDGDDPTYINANEFRKKPDGTLYSGSPDVIRLTNNTGSTVLMTLTNGDSSVSSYHDVMSIVGIAYNDGNTLNQSFWFNRLDTRQTLSVSVPNKATIYWGRMGSHFSAYYSYKLESDNNPPTQPGAFITQPASNSINLPGEVMTIQWGASTDPEGNSIKYTLEFYNGSSWSAIASNLTALIYSHTLPSMDATSAQYRVKAVDSKGGESAYRTSNVFTVRKHLLLIKEDDTIRTYKGGWKTVTSPTVEQFKEYGMADLSELTEDAIKQLESDNFQILVLTKDTAINTFSLETTAVPKRQLVIQETEMSLPAPIQSFKLTASEAGTGVLRVIISTDNAATWKTYNGETWLDVDIANLDEVAAKGMTVATLNSISEETWKPFLEKLKIRFAYYLDLGAATDTTTLDKLEYTTVPVVNKTPKLNSIKIAYDDLTIEGRLKDLERINAINMAKLNFKSNALLLSEKYEMHDMVIDTCDTDEMVTVSSVGAGELLKASEAFSVPITLGAGKVSEIPLSKYSKIKKVEVK